MNIEMLPEGYYLVSVEKNYAKRYTEETKNEISGDYNCLPADAMQVKVSYDGSILTLAKGDAYYGHGPLNSDALRLILSVGVSNTLPVIRHYKESKRTRPRKIDVGDKFGAVYFEGGRRKVGYTIKILHKKFYFADEEPRWRNMYLGLKVGMDAEPGDTCDSAYWFDERGVCEFNDVEARFELTRKRKATK